MLQWNELRISPDRKYLIIDVEVWPGEFYKDIYIQKITLSYYKSSEDYTTSIEAKRYLWRDIEEFALDGERWEEVGQKNTKYKRVRRYIDIDGIGDNLLFVTALCNSDYAEGTPCELQEPSLLGITYDKSILYNINIDILKNQIACKVDDNLINYILKMKSFDLALNCGDYKTAIDYWNNFIKKPITYLTKCHCHDN